MTRNDISPLSTTELVSCYEDTTGEDLSHCSRDEVITCILRLRGEDAENFAENFKSYIG